MLSMTHFESEESLRIHQQEHPCIDQVRFGDELCCCAWKWRSVLNTTNHALLNGLLREDALPPTVCAYDMGSACFEGQESVGHRIRKNIQQE